MERCGRGLVKHPRPRESGLVVSGGQISLRGEVFSTTSPWWPTACRGICRLSAAAQGSPLARRRPG